MLTSYLWLLSSCWVMGGDDTHPRHADAAEHAELELDPDPPSPPTRTPPPAPPVAPGEPQAALTSELCTDLEEGGPVAGPDCITATIACGDTVIGHTIGGTERFDTQFYERHHCTPATSRHDGGDERVYLLEMPPGPMRATVYLDTPCADLDLAAMRVIDAATCPTIDTMVKQCDMWPKKGTRREKVELSSNEGATWLLVIEGKADAEGAFGLTVECVDHL